MKTIRKQTSSISGSRFFIILLSIYFILLLIVSYLACFFSYQQKKEELVAQISSSFIQLKQEYRNITDNFWQVYLPIFESDSNIYHTIMQYFSCDDSLSPLEKKDLGAAARQLLVRDNDIQWLVLYNSNRDTNYIIYNNETSIQTLPDVKFRIPENEHLWNETFNYQYRHS